MGRERTPGAEAPPPPADLRAARVRLGSGTYVLLSFPRPAPGGWPPSLTPAERHVAHALLDGLSHADIARLRGSRPRTVAKQVASIYAKLGVGSRAELAARWGSLGG